MDALIKSLRPNRATDAKSTDLKLPEARPAELDPAEFLAAAVRPDQPRPSRAEAEQAVHTLISYIGEDAGREGLLDTPRRVVEAFDELYQGYHLCPAEVLDRTFGETAGYDDFVLVRDIEFTSQCEHHMMPFYGRAHIAYTPVERVGGIVEAGTAHRHFRATAADPGTPHRADRGRDRRSPQAARRRRDDRGGAYLHVGARCRQAWRDDLHQPLHRHVPRQSGGAGPVHVDGARPTAVDSALSSSADTHEREEGLAFNPKFDAAGLVTCVATDAATGGVLMVAHMNEEALRKTIASGEAWYFSRSRNALWRKGESSGQTQRVVEMRMDCDQDAVWIRVEQQGAACHTGRRSCFYRAVTTTDGTARLAFVDADRLFDPAAVYRK